MIRYIFLSVIFSLLVISCKKNSDTYILSGEAVGFPDGTEIYINNFSFSEKRTLLGDTLVVKDGKFSGLYKTPNKPTLNILKVEGTRISFLYFPEDTDIKVTLYKDSIQASKILGGKQNKENTAYNQAVVKYNLKRESLINESMEAGERGDTALVAILRTKEFDLLNEETNFRRDFLQKQPQSLFSIMLLSEMIGRKEISSLEAHKFLENLDPELEEIELTKELRSKIETMMKADIGVKAPDFSGPTPDGDTLALSEVLGKYTIIDFWASWCKSCREENPNVVRMYKKYHDKGLNIISVSLDRKGEKDKWVKAIQEDGMDWYHVSHLEFWDEPILENYNIKAIPATFLLDENGVIIDKDLRGVALEVKLATLFGE